MEFDILPGEAFYGGAVMDGINQPYTQASERELDLTRNQTPNQMMPLLLSTAGRWVWNPDGMRISFRKGRIQCTDGTILGQSTGGLRQAYLGAMEHCFPLHEIRLDERLFSSPVYNTWIELTFHQTQEGVLQYARAVLENGLPPGVLMIDDGWSDSYGRWHFSREKFYDPEGMLSELHRLGFTVMLWICPFITPDTQEYRELEQTGLLVTDRDGKSYISHWWNGWSAVLDMTQPAACSWLKRQLDGLQAMGVDGFKFDAGDIYYMTGDYAYFDKTADKHLFSQRWAEIGAYFPYNELRAAWKTGGMPIVQRLGDKSYSWHSSSLNFPDMSAAGLLGYAYTCPDMIGGGEFKSFLNVGDKKLDEELIVRSCQIHALMPMMQFSVAPWRVLSKENMEICSRYARLHEQMGDYILECARNSAQTGEPIVRNMEYAYPHQGFEECKDQFMLGSRFLVAPMVKKGTVREVWLPKGIWRDDQGKKIRGPKSLTIEVPLNRLPYYERIK